MAVPTRWVFLAVLILGAIGLARTHRYYGTLYYGTDAQYYYGVARSIVFDGDMDVTNDLRLSPNPRPFDADGDGVWERLVLRADGRILSKWPIGMSLVEAPFILVGHGLRSGLAAAGVTVEGPPGYSGLELSTVATGLLILFAIGLSALYSVLAASHGAEAALLGCSVCWLGTSLFYYSAIFPFMAHAMSFVLLGGVLLALRRLAEGNRLNWALAGLGVAVALLFLVRPQQSVVGILCLPFVLGVVRGRPTVTWLTGACAAALACVTALGMQLWVNFDQFGTVTLSGYAQLDESFSWTRPEIREFLLGPDQGLLVVSPIVALASLGLVTDRTSVPRFMWPLVANAACQIYLIAAWGTQGDTFGARMWSDNAAVVAIGLAALVRGRGALARVAVWTVSMLACSWTTYRLAVYVGVVG